MTLRDVFRNLSDHSDTLRDALRVPNANVLLSLLGPAARGFLQKRDYMAWTLSQFLHGEQGALFAAAQVLTQVRWLDGRRYASTRVMDEGRHVEVFHRYLSEKLGKRYEINDNLYVILDAVMADSRWDVKFLGMQIMIEGLALGAFGTIRARSRGPRHASAGCGTGGAGRGASRQLR